MKYNLSEISGFNDLLKPDYNNTLNSIKLSAELIILNIKLFDMIRIFYVLTLYHLMGWHVQLL